MLYLVPLHFLFIQPNFFPSSFFLHAFQTPLLPYTSLRPLTRTGPMRPYRRCRIPRFDPEKWNAPPTIRRNNCYNYATDIQTDTFAQPGEYVYKAYRPLGRSTRLIDYTK